MAPTRKLVEVAHRAAGECGDALALSVEAEVRRRGLEGDGKPLALGLCGRIPLPPKELGAAGNLDVGIMTCQLGLTEI